MTTSYGTGRFSATAPHIRPLPDEDSAYSIDTMRSLVSRLVIGLIILAVPLALLLMAQNRYASSAVREQAVDSSRNLVDYHMDRIDRDLEDTAIYLSSVLVLNEDLAAMNRATSNLEYQLARLRLANQLYRDILLNPSADAFFVYIADREDYLDVGGRHDVFDERQALRPIIADLVKTDSAESRLISAEGKTFIAQIVRTPDVCVGAWVSLERTLEPMRAVDLGEKGGAAFIDAEGTLLTRNDLPARYGLDLRKRSEGKLLRGTGNDFLTIEQKSRNGTFFLIALIAEDEILRKLPYFQILINIATVGIIVLLPLYLVFLRKMVLRPLYGIVGTTRRIRDGDLDHRVEPAQSSEEFELLGTSINDMLDQIRKLKIDVYEDQIAMQRNELRHLQLQLKPHFFLNALNLVFHLAQLNKNAEIKNLVLDMVRYFRFMFRDNLERTSLREELELVRAYLRIQEMRNPGSIVLNISVDDGLLGIDIPPLVIHTFVENTVKHAIKAQSATRLDISAARDTDSVGIIVKDDGPGFQEETLEKLRKGERIVYEDGDHIGFWNVRRRLSILYGGAASLKCSNDGGARVEIRIPYRG